jgi:alanine racemase
MSANSAYLPSAIVPAGTVGEQFDPWLEIDTKNLEWNISQVQGMIGPKPIMAVVKCNAYGHGTVGIAKVMQKQGVQKFAVVKVSEAIALRENGIEGTILNFGPFSPSEAQQIISYDISQSVFSEAIDVLAEVARELGKPAKVHIKVDSGLSRVGIPYRQALSYIKKIAVLPDITIEGIFTTLAQENDFDLVQIERLNKVCEDAEKIGISVGVRHAASTDAVMKYAPSYLDMVRPGNCFYGFEPLLNLNLKPVMALKTRVIMVKKVYPGDTISYHRRLKVEDEKLLAILPLGYADGYPFQAVNKAEVLIHGRRWPLIVYMSANHATVDITGAHNVQVGDEVVLFGKQGAETISIMEVAEWGESSVYKVATGMSPFLPRVYIE